MPHLKAFIASRACVAPPYLTVLAVTRLDLTTLLLPLYSSRPVSHPTPTTAVSEASPPVSLLRPDFTASALEASTPITPLLLFCSQTHGRVSPMCTGIGLGGWRKLTGGTSRCWTTTQKRQKTSAGSAGFLQEQNGMGSDLPPLCLRGTLKLNKSQALVRRLSLQSGEVC